MVDNETIESFLIQMDYEAEQLGEGLWRVRDAEGLSPAVIVSYDSPIVYVRLKVMAVPEANRERLFQRLLELNAHGIAYGAYAVENGEVVLLDTLPAEKMDKEELQASIESLQLAVTEHFRELQQLVSGAE